MTEPEYEIWEDMDNAYYCQSKCIARKKESEIKPEFRSPKVGDIKSSSSFSKFWVIRTK